MNAQTILFQTILFSISRQFSSIWSIDMTQTGATTLGYSGPWSDGIKRVLRIPQKLQYYWTLNIVSFGIINRTLVGGVLTLCRDALGVLYSSRRLGQVRTGLTRMNLLVYFINSLTTLSSSLFTQFNFTGHKYEEGLGESNSVYVIEADYTWYIFLLRNACLT